MAFDLSTAKNIEQSKPSAASGFDLSTAKAIDGHAETSPSSLLDSIGDFFTGKLRATQQQKELPELQDSGILSSEDGVKVAAVTPALLTATDPNEIAKIVSGNFPNVGVSYNKDNQGNVYPVLVNNETGAATIINKPGVSAFDWLQGIGISAALAPTSTAATIPAIVGKAVAGESALQGIQSVSGGDFDAEDVAIAGAGAGALALGAKAVGNAPKVKGLVNQATDSLFNYQTPTKKRIAALLQEGSTDIETARYKLYDPLRLSDDSVDAAFKAGTDKIIEPELIKNMRRGASKVKKDPESIEAIKQGFDEGVIAAIKGSSDTDKAAFNKMVNIAERGIKNQKFAQKFRPTDVAGDTLMQKVRVVSSANKKAGRMVDNAAKSLKGKKIESLNIGQGFRDSLDEMGITIKDDLTLDFDGSDIDGLAGPMRAIQNVFNRISKGGEPDAYQLHRVKRYIDENVTYGDGLTGLKGKSERVLKKLRSSIDQTLDENFPSYDKANSAYSETINALDALKDVAGKKLDLDGSNAEKATGTLLRRIMSNAQSRVPLIDAIDIVENTAKKYDGFGGVPKIGNIPENGDLMTQILFADELDNIFGATARTSLKGQVEQATKDTAQAASSKAGLFQAGVDLLGKAAERARGINQDAAFKSIRDLVKETK